MDSLRNLEAPKKSWGKNGSGAGKLQRGREDFEMLEDHEMDRPALRFAKGRSAGAGVELVPRPSNSKADPLNWSRWRKELAFFSLMLSAAVIGILKTMLVTVNAVLALELNVSQSAAAGLTGAPLILGAVAGLVVRMQTPMIGKRGIYLGSSVIMLLGAVWNMHIFESYASFLISRICQGLGWGAFEALIVSSISDLFFVHERTSRINAYNTISIIFTWGSPILGGYLSQSTAGFRNVIMIVNIIQAFSILFLFLGTPETTFDRSSSTDNSGRTLTSTTITTVSTPSKSGFKLYLSTLKLTTPHSTRKFSIEKCLLPLKALYAPSTLLAFLLTAPLSATSFALATTLSFTFTAMPTFLFPSRLGFLFILPLVFSLLSYSISSLIIHLRTKPPHHLSGTLGKALPISIPGIVISVAGLLAFGLYTDMQLMPMTGDNGLIFALVVPEFDISLQTVSLLFGILVSGSVLLTYTGQAHLSSSGNGAGDTPMLGAHRVLQDCLTGVFVIGMPVWVRGLDNSVEGLKGTSIALGVLGTVLGSTACAVLWVKGDGIRGVDERVLGRLEEEDREGLKSRDSFFDA